METVTWATRLCEDLSSSLAQALAVALALDVDRLILRRHR
jgi:hypothetical protein